MSIVMKDVSKIYGQGRTAVHALRSIDFEEEQGGFTVILGPSGSGKTTMLNLIGAIDEPTGGALEVAGVDLGGL
ncbi:MAG: ATP-binding cassette domain-containing protein, partial [Gemmatimonadetes bacterium]|nr:ATP-binding cassette domain-containing protein [Gemmatimonadota bacterium]